MSRQLRQVIGLSKKTGDRIVVYDNSDPDNSYVVMSIDEYLEILGLNEKRGEKSNLTEENRVGTIENSAKNQVISEDPGFPKENMYSSGQILKNRFKNNQNWQIPSSIKEAAESEEN